MTSKLLKVFLLLAILAVVVNAAPSNDTTNVIDECIKRENCAPDDRECRSACAGVPDPDPKVANDTRACYDKCANDNLPQNEKAYSDCTQKCKTDVYQEGVTEPGSSAPNKGGSSGTGSGNSGSGSSQDNGGGNSTNTTDNASNSSSDKNTTSSAVSFTTGSAGYVYAFAAIFACVVFGIGL